MGLETPAEVVVVSAYGRGHWMAAEFRSRGMSVTLIDVSDALGHWAPEDIEGPWGFFHSEKVTPSQLQRLEEEDYSEKVEDGFTLWLRTGPVDLLGPHSNYLLQQLEVPENVVKYVSKYDELSEKDRQNLRIEIGRLPFSRRWFAELAHAVAAPTHQLSFEYSKVGRPAALFAPHFVRRVTRRGFEKSLQWLRDRGVQVFEKAKVKDVAIDAGVFLSVEIEADRSGVIMGEQFVWTLSSQETARLNAAAHFELFGGRVVKHEWVWARYRMELTGPTAETLPLKFWLLAELSDPWTHEVFLAIQKTTAPNQFDIWAKIPECHRFQKAYLEQVGERIVALISERTPGGLVRIAEYPQEHGYDETVVGSARHGFYNEEELSKLRHGKLSNTQFDGPELWETEDVLGQWSHQGTIVATLAEWKDEKELRLKKLAAKEQGQ